MTVVGGGPQNVGQPVDGGNLGDGVASSSMAPQPGQGGMTPEQWSWLSAFMNKTFNTMVYNNTTLLARLDIMSSDIHKLQASILI